ncbi:MAG: hypothetical protein JW876_07690 [Candidatus Krumholzibacteriota bacterium]|nr:hypothetical protein [Candidatus Krumholzibacteriota bacterium]
MPACRLSAASLFVLACLVACSPHPGLADGPGERPAGLPAGECAYALVAAEAAERGLPVIEDTTVYFVYLNDAAATVAVAGDFNGWNDAADRMRRVPGTGTWHLRKTFERDARLDYKFVVDGDTWLLDPRNPRTVEGGFGLNSAFAMPAYEPPDEIESRSGVARGRIDTLVFHSDSLGNDRAVYVYLPPGYGREGGGPYPMLLVNDGGDYLRLGSMATVLDNLMDGGEIDPLVALFVDPVDRRGEYALSFVFASMITDELLPAIESRYRLVADPAGRGVMGASLGGLVSVFLAGEHPEVFGFCASQSGAFGVADDWLIRRIDAGGKRPIRVYLDWGSYEGELADSNRRLAASLEARGYDFTAAVVHEGHSWGSWRARIDDILRSFLPATE